MHFTHRQTARLLGTVLLMSLISLTLFFAQAQDDAPAQLQAALNDLSNRVGETVTVETLDAYNWVSRSYPDASLGCPQPDTIYTQVVTPGYEFTLTFDGTLYDYRVSENGETVILCNSTSTTPTQPTTDVVIDLSPCGDTYNVTPDDTLIDIAEQCNRTVDALLKANPEITDPGLIYVGQQLDIPAYNGQPELLPTPTPNNGQQVSITPRIGPPGMEVHLSANGFTPNEAVEIGIGRWESEYDVIKTLTTNARGNLETDITVPDFVDTGDLWVFVVVDDFEETISGTFRVVDDTLLTPTPTEDAAVFERVTFYLVARNDNGETGKLIGCGDSLIPVEVEVEPTSAPLTAALESLFAVDTELYGQSGLYNPLYRADLTVEGIDIDNKIAQINLSGELEIGGTCDVPRIQGQLTQTALQYDTIDSVNININGQPLEQILSGM